MTFSRKQEAFLPIKRIYITTFILFALIWTASGCAAESFERHGSTANSNGSTAGDQSTANFDSEIGRAFKTGTSDVQVQGEGIVIGILKDDLSGSRHQRFIVRIASGQTVLIVHNIDLAPRIATLQEGDNIGFYGEYVWNAEGGKVHWTHHDPGGRHVAGWLKHKGRNYQ